VEQIYVPLLSALIASLIVSATSITTMIVQNHYQARRERTRLAVKAAIEDYKTVVERGPAGLPPISLYLHLHARLLDALETGKLTPETLRDIHRQQREMQKVFRETTS
jgi:predicted nucleic-acid-binding protein